MNYFTKDQVISAIGDATELIELTLGREGSILISEYGGRPLGIFPKKDCYSMLWINQKIRETIEARDRAIGGDRYWISPEQDYFYKDPEHWSGWFCPSGLDPANYEILGSSQKSCTLSTAITITNMRTKHTYRGEVTRQFTAIKEPISTGLSYIGLEFIDDCVFFAPDLKMNGWTLANIISGGPDNPGTVLVPTKADPKPLSYFRIIPDDRLVIGENYVGYKIDVDDIYKLAIRPEDIDFERKAKIGYVLKMPDSGDYGFLVKLSDDIPRTQDECFDKARDNPDSEIGVIQSYNAESPDKPILRYGEIELQLNMFKTIDNTSHCKAIHQLLAYIGTKEEILDVIEKYLGISNPKLF
ncbi:MAG: DUF6786 family protein [Promethearchaeota archaeon]